MMDGRATVSESTVAERYEKQVRYRDIVAAVPCESKTAMGMGSRLWIFLRLVSDKPAIAVVSTM